MGKLGSREYSIGTGLGAVLASTGCWVSLEKLGWAAVR